MKITRLNLGEYMDFECLTKDELSKFRSFNYSKSSILYASKIKFIILTKGYAKLVYMECAKEFILYFLKPGNMVFVDEDLTVEFLEDSHILELNVRNLNQLLSNEKFSMSLINALLRNIILQRQIIKDIVFKNVQSSVLNFLRSLKPKQGNVVAIPFSITTLSNLLGFERPSVSTALNKLIKSGVIKRCGKNKFLLS